MESGVRAGEVIDRSRALVKKAPPQKDSQKDKVDINEAILEVLVLLRTEIAKNRSPEKRSSRKTYLQFGEIVSS